MNAGGDLTVPGSGIHGQCNAFGRLRFGNKPRPLYPSDLRSWTLRI
jgi:hypothetical protein